MDSTSVNKAVQTISEIFDALSLRFGATGTHLWEEMIRYKFYSALIPIIITGIALVVSAIFMKKMFVLYREDRFKYDGHAFVSALVFVMLVIVFMFTVSISGPVVLAPEAAVIQSLIP